MYQVTTATSTTSATSTSTSNDHSKLRKLDTSAKQTEPRGGTLCFFVDRETTRADYLCGAKIMTQHNNSEVMASNLDANNSNNNNNLLQSATVLMRSSKHKQISHKTTSNHYNDSNKNNHRHHRTKTNKLKPSLVHLTILVLACATLQTTSDRQQRWSQVSAQTSLLNSPLYLSSSSILTSSSSSAGNLVVADSSAPSSILKRDLSTPQRSLRNGKSSYGYAILLLLARFHSSSIFLPSKRTNSTFVLASLCLRYLLTANPDLANDGQSTIAHLRIRHLPSGR